MQNTPSENELEEKQAMYSETMIPPMPTFVPEDKGYIPWYQHCNCCPYGYHIDLDFVRYCESIGEAVDRTGSIKRRKDRRRQRKSMEVLLGLEPPALLNLEQVHHTAIQEESPKPQRKQLNIKQSPAFEDALEEVVSDFERTLQRSKKVPKNLPDVTAVHDSIRRVPSVSSMSSVSGSSMTVLPSTTDGRVARDFDTSSDISCGMSSTALHVVREQMALSLERTKELEERVKIIPSLQAQLQSLKQEKVALLSKIKTVEHTTTIYNGGYAITPPISTRTRSLSFTRLEGEQKSHVPTRRDCGVTCTVLTRTVGVGNQFPHTKTVSTCTLELDNYSDKWLPEKTKFLGIDNVKGLKPAIVVVKGTQTPLPREKSDLAVQTLESKPDVHLKCTQTTEKRKLVHNVGVLAIAPTSDVSTEVSILTRTLGVSDDTIDQFFCPKCNPEKTNLPDSLSLSLASLLGPRSRSFNLGEDKLNLAKNRTVGCQYEPFNSSKSCQYEVATHTRACQKDVKVNQKAVQYEGSFESKNTDTKDLETARRHAACNTTIMKEDSIDAGCNTENEYCCPSCTKTNSIRRKEKRDLEVKKQELEREWNELESQKKLKEKLEREKERSEVKRDDIFLPSKIPRLQAPATPVEVRKFRRQDTYTKIPSSVQEAVGLSGLNFKDDSESCSSFTKVKQTCKLPEISTPQNGIQTTEHNVESETTLPLSENSLYHPISQTQRKKKTPSKEMQGAMKVLNDSLQKGQIKNLKKSATNIIQQEWFQVSSLINANPLDVEDYLDCFEEISYDLLHYIVNTVDASGNTAMHYAVSHGNFDVVSILLDSKVCDINQQNKAGYTSVMLVSLAEVRSPTHANVVKRLFQLADVNLRAKQHGQTALMLAVSHGRLDMVRMLLEAGAEINIQDEDGSTALMCAAEHGHIDIVKHFLNQPDCDSTLTDVDGSTALKIAMEAGHRHIGVLLYAHERSLHGPGNISKHKRTKSSGSPKPGSSPLLPRSSRALTDSKTNK